MGQLSEKQSDSDAEDAPFNPYHLRPLASLNRRRTISLPGIDPEWVGKTGWDLLSKHALINLIRPHALELGLQNTAAADLPVDLNTLLSSPDGPTCAIAESIAACYGRRLGCFLVSMLHASQGITSPIVKWEVAYLEHWKEKVREIVLGGGLSNGRFGKLVRGAAECVPAQCGIQGRRIRVAEHPSYLPLIGAARNIADGLRGQAIVIDFGGTRAKRGVASYDDRGALHGLRVLPSYNIEALTQPGKTAELATRMTAIVAETMEAADPSTPVVPHILCSVAAYVQDGQPVRNDRGVYTALHHMSSDITGWFSRQISRASGKAVRIEFFRDADVAACAYAGYPDTAILMLGSALGAGFAPPGHSYRPVADPFVVETADE